MHRQQVQNTTGHAAQAIKRPSSCSHGWAATVLQPVRDQRLWAPPSGGAHRRFGFSSDQSETASDQIQSSDRHPDPKIRATLAAGLSIVCGPLIDGPSLPPSEEDDSSARGSAAAPCCCLWRLWDRRCISSPIGAGVPQATPHLLMAGWVVGACCSALLRHLPVVNVFSPGMRYTRVPLDWAVSGHSIHDGR